MPNFGIKHKATYNKNSTYELLLLSVSCRRLNIIKQFVRRYVVLLIVEAVMVASGMQGKCHKFVVCTSPRSKLKHSSTDAPTELRRVTIDDTMVHLLSFGSYFSTEFKDEEPSFPPRA